MRSNYLVVEVEPAELSVDLRVDPHPVHSEAEVPLVTLYGHVVPQMVIQQRAHRQPGHLTRAWGSQVTGHPAASPPTAWSSDPSLGVTGHRSSSSESTDSLVI